MPSNMLPIVDPAITRGMNTIDDPKILKPGECVRLLNAFPGEPIIPRTGCTGIGLDGSADNKFVSDDTNGCVFIPPAIPIIYSTTKYIVSWILDVSESQFYLILINKSSGVFTVFAVAEFTDTEVLFGFLELHDNIYCSMTEAPEWISSASTTVQKVIESPSIVRDMCIATEGKIDTLEQVDFVSQINAHVSTGLTAGKYYDYAFQFVRQISADYFENGSTSGALILPQAAIDAGFEQSKRVDIFETPGAVIGVENVDNRKQILIIDRDATVEITVTDACAGSTNSFTKKGYLDVDALFDDDITTPAFNATGVSAAVPTGGGTGGLSNGGGIYMIIYAPFTSYRPSSYKIGLYMAEAGSTAVYKVQYLTIGSSTWVDCATGFAPTLAGLNTKTLSISNVEHIQDLRLILTTAPTGTDPYCMEVYLYAAGKHTEITLEQADQVVAMGSGATHLRVYRSLGQITEDLAKAATKFFVTDLPLDETAATFEDYTSDAALEGELNQLVTGYSVAPAGAYFKYIKGRLFLLTSTGKCYYSEFPGGDDGTDKNLAEAYPQAWASLFKPLTMYLDCDQHDGQTATGEEILGNDIFFFKERKIFGLFGGDPTVTALSQISNTIGCVFPYTITRTEIKGWFGKCILFLGNECPMVMEEGGRIRAFSEFRIKELWPRFSDELYSQLEDHPAHIVKNCTAAFVKDTWWVTYYTYEGLSKTFGYYFNPSLASGNNTIHGPLEFSINTLTVT